MGSKSNSYRGATPNDRPKLLKKDSMIDISGNHLPGKRLMIEAATGENQPAV
jgi:hypothetical protein